MADKPRDQDAFVNPFNVGGGSLMLAWQLKDKTVLIVGGGEVASQRLDSVIGTDARMVVLCPQSGLNARTRRYIELFPERITYHDRTFTGAAELNEVDLVLTAIDDHIQSRDIVELCRQAKIPVNAADIPDLCDFFFGAQIRDGPLQVMISTNGNGPRLSGLMRKKLQAGLSGYEGEAITKIGALRAQLKKRAPGVGGPLGRRRMQWMTQVCDKWDMEDFTQLDDSMIQGLLDEGWEKERVPTIEELGGKPIAKKAPSQETGSHPAPTSSFSNAVPWSLGLITGAALSFAYIKYARLS
ncbi:monooxygenase [Marasmius tenuissimus]|uniref:precorrin-2 dehydrogenase n=1 Tax=Marasmius tenuissimus TaxID=585030 RepID=A0ABR3ABQ3_9AGAR